MKTSMAREGCIPDNQFKWSHYASFVLQARFGHGEDPERHREQALLQHYGWRSFFIDASANPAVSAWFASHKFDDNTTFALADDCHQQPVMTIHQAATYEFHGGSGYLYAISIDKLSEAGVKTFDLASIAPQVPRLRPNVQAAWLIGPLAEDLPVAAIVMMIKAPAAILAEYARQSGLQAVEDLFPTRREDSILHLFLSIPWQRLIEQDPFAAGPLPSPFQRGLRLPEYDFDPVRRHPPEVAFFRPFWIARRHEPGQLPFGQALFCCVPETIFYARRLDGDSTLRHLRRLLSKRPIVILESSHLMRYPPFDRDFAYTKGVCVRQWPDGLVEIGDFGLDHPGTLVDGLWVNRGRYYQWTDEDALSPVAHPEECPCHFELRHSHHLSSLMILDDMLASNAFRQIGEREFQFVQPNRGDGSIGALL